MCSRRLVPQALALVLLAAPMARANLLSDPGFETGAPWSLWSYAHIETWAARSGANGLGFYGWGTGGGAFQDVGARGESNYTFSVWGLKEPEFLASFSLEMKLEFRNAAGATISVSNRFITGTDNTWVLYSLSAPSPLGTETVRVTLAYTGPYGTAGAFKWDDGSLESAPYVPPACYVSPTGSHTQPFTTWATAATNIQDAVDTAQAGGTVFVGPGFYAPPAPVVVTNALALRAFAGPADTFVSGSGARRVFHLDHAGAILDGFTVTNGWSARDASSNSFGGGVWCRGGLVTNCVITGNRLGRPGDNPWEACGAGLYLVDARAIRCTIAGNSIQAGRDHQAPLGAGNGLGGGVYALGSVVEACTVRDNSVLGGYGSMGYFGGDALGAGIYAATGSTVRGGAVLQNAAEGGRGTGHGHGDAYGAGVYCAGGAVVESASIVSNTARAPDGDPTWSPGSALGGGAYGAGGGTIQSCTIADNRAMGLDGYYGGSGFAGGVWMDADLLVQSCLIARNAAIGGSGSGNLSAAGHAIGGGAAGRGRLRNCTIADNRCTAGSGYYGNTDSRGGGLYGLDAVACENTIVYFNTATNDPDIYTNTGSAAFSHCCATPDPGGPGNQAADPLFAGRAAGDYRLADGSPCRNAGDNATAGGATDVEGHPRVAEGVVDIGAHERTPAGTVNLLLNPGFETGCGESVPSWTAWDNARIEPWAACSGSNGLAFYGWTAGGGVYQDIEAGGFSNYTFTVEGFRDNDLSILYYIQARLEFLDADGNAIDFVQNVVRGTNTWQTYTLSGPSPRRTARVRVVLSFSGSAGPGGAFKWDDASLTSVPYPLVPDIHYCSPTGAMVYPYTNWQNASRSVVVAARAAHAGDTILLAPGIYDSTNPVVADEAYTILGMNGATGTVVKNGARTNRIVHVVHPGAVLDGLTITNGFLGGSTNGSYGAGVYCPSGGVVRNCRITGNQINGNVPYLSGVAGGAGLYMAGTGRIENCAIVGNQVIYGLNSGGGLSCSGDIVVSNCVIANNRADGGIINFYYGQGGAGGGASLGQGVLMEDCVVSGNVATASGSMYPGTSMGGGVCASGTATVRRCLITGNTAFSGSWGTRGDGKGAGGGVYLSSGARLENCIVYGNRVQSSYYYGDAYGGGICAAGSAKIVHCTVFGNTEAADGGADLRGGGGICTWYGPVVENTILHGNVSSLGGAENWHSAGTSTFSHCCTTPAVPGAGNLNADPRLADIGAGDAHLLPDSPCIDRGGVPASVAMDLEGAPRPLDGDGDGDARADVGAYEAPAGTATPNLLVNGTLETPSAWVFIDDARLEPWAARNGTNGLALYGWTDGGLAWQDVGAEGTSNYTFSAWGFRDPDFPAGLTVEMKLEFLSAGLTPLAVTQRLVAGSAAWTSFSIGGISPPDTKVVRVVLAFSGTPGAGGAFKWDDAVLLSSEAEFHARYVAAGAGHVHPYTNWAGAATNLQAAIAAADAHDTILVSNGVYLGEAVVDKPLSIRGLGGVRLVGKSAYPYTDQVRALRVNAGCLLDLRNVTIAGGCGNQGGGICNLGTLVLKDSSIVSNEANLINGYGGGLYNGGTATIERCSISFNRARGEGTPSAGTGFGGGIYCAAGSVLVVTDSALVGNRAHGDSNYNIREGGSGYGGAICSDGGAVTLIGVTLATNSAAGAWGGYNPGSGFGGAVYASGAGTMTLRSCTVAGNSAIPGSASSSGNGGGIHVEIGAPAVNVDNTIVARNAAVTRGPDVCGTLHASGRNLLGNSADCVLAGDAGGVIVGSDPGLTGLADHGGPTLSCVPLYGSPAVDQGSTNGVAAFDQRGVARPIDGNFDGQARNDIGACEYDPHTMDSDGDALTDADEVLAHGSNPLLADSDDDGMGDAHEVRAGTSPTDESSVLDLDATASADWEAGGIVVRWSSVDGKQYTLMRATDLAAGFTVLEESLSGTAPENVYTDATATAEGPYFYRVKVE